MFNPGVPNTLRCSKSFQMIHLRFLCLTRCAAADLQFQNLDFIEILSNGFLIFSKTGDLISGIHSNSKMILNSFRSTDPFWFEEASNRWLNSGERIKNPKNSLEWFIFNFFSIKKKTICSLRDLTCTVIVVWSYYDHLRVNREKFCRL